MVDCIIVGGGLVGMLSARELKKSGLDVLILDKGALGKESSWAGGGILSPLHPWRYSDEINRLASVGHQHYPQLAEELYQESGIDPEYIRCGMLVLNSDETIEAATWAKKWSMNMSCVNQTSDLQGILPGLNSRFEQGLWMPDIAQMRNPRLVQSVKGSLFKLNIPYKEHTTVDQFKVVNGRINGVVANGEIYHANKVLVASGAWSAKLLEAHGDVPNIQPVKGQMILFNGPKGMLKSMILAENRYLIPRKDGRILCGSSIEHSGFDKSTSNKVKDDLLQSATSIFPELANIEIEHHWSGLRPGSPEGEPVIKAHEKIQGLFINAGHYRNGIILSLGSAQRVTKLMTA